MTIDIVVNDKVLIQFANFAFLGRALIGRGLLGLPRGHK